MEEEQRIADENQRIKEWERKFDEEQKKKEEELIKKFYSDHQDSKIDTENTINDNENKNN